MVAINDSSTENTTWSVGYSAKNLSTAEWLEAVDVGMLGRPPWF